MDTRKAIEDILRDVGQDYDRTFGTDLQPYIDRILDAVNVRPTANFTDALAQAIEAGTDTGWIGHRDGNLLPVDGIVDLGIVATTLLLSMRSSLAP